MRSGRTVWAAGTLFVAHEVMLHSAANTLLEQGGLFGQDRVQDILLDRESEYRGFIPKVSSLMYDRLGRFAATSMLDMVTSRHDPRVVNALLDRLNPMVFRLLLQHVEEEHLGLTDGIRVILNMASVPDHDLQWRFIETLISVGAVDRIVEGITVSVAQRSGRPITLRQWLVQNPNEAIHFVRERESAIRAFTKLLANPRFSARLYTDFDSCFLDADDIRGSLGNKLYPAASLITLLSKSAIGAIGKRNAAKARALYLAELRPDDPQRQFLAKNKSLMKGSTMLSFVMPHFEEGERVSFERMKLAGSLGIIASAVTMVIGRRSGSVVKTMLRTGIGSSLFVLWNDLFINWDRFFTREKFPVFDRSTKEGRNKDLIWSILCSCAHYFGNLNLFVAFPGSFLPYLLISSSHFTGELYTISNLFGASHPPHAPQIWIRPGPSEEL